MTGDERERAVAEGRVTLLDVRSPAEFRGEAGYPCDPRQGHIPGAVNVEWSELFESEGRPLGSAEIRALVSERGGDPDRPVVAYCHSGQRSGFAVSALRAAGLEAENYEGSWHEWSRRDAEG